MSWLGRPGFVEKIVDHTKPIRFGWIIVKQTLRFALAAGKKPKKQAEGAQALCISRLSEYLLKVFLI